MRLAPKQLGTPWSVTHKQYYKHRIVRYGPTILSYNRLMAVYFRFYVPKNALWFDPTPLSAASRFRYFHCAFYSLRSAVCLDFIYFINIGCRGLIVFLVRFMQEAKFISITAKRNIIQDTRLSSTLQRLL